MVAALIVAEAIGLTLLVTRPPIHNAPVSLSELARQLRGTDAPGAGGPPDFQGGEPMGPPLPGDLGDGAGGPELSFRYSLPAPQPTPGSPLRAVPDLQRLLAARLHVATDRVRVFVQRDGLAAGPPPGGPGADPQLLEGFLAGLQQDSGMWHIVESVVLEA